MCRNHQLLGFMLVFGGVAFYYHVVSTIQLMVSWWFFWPGGLDSWGPHDEKECYFGAPVEFQTTNQNHQFIITFPETNSSPLKIGLLPPKGKWSSNLPFSGRVLELSLVPRTVSFCFQGSWAWALDTPFKSTKLVAAHFGGTRTPMVMSWPKVWMLWDIPPKFSRAP